MFAINRTRVTTNLATVLAFDEIDVPGVYRSNYDFDVYWVQVGAGTGCGFAIVEGSALEEIDDLVDEIRAGDWVHLEDAELKIELYDGDTQLI